MSGISTRSGLGATIVRTAIAAASALFASPGVVAAGLNDTGQTLCYRSDGTVVPCVGGGYDGRFGRDAAAAAGALPKTGAGSAGFDFTKVALNGSVLPANATIGLGTNPTDWACTYDNTTGLLWEMKSPANVALRYRGNTYAWLSSTNNGGNPGNTGTNTCNGSLSAFGDQCNTNNYVLAVNAAGLCGHSDWRLPRASELLSIVSLGSLNPAIDGTHFPDVQIDLYWSGTNLAIDNTKALTIKFSDGSISGQNKTLALYVRLVRNGL